VSFYSSLATPRDLVTDKSPEGAKKRAERPNYLLEVDNPVVVPVGKKVRIITTANDVIHAWSVPAFGVKQDAIPGFVRDTWFRADKVGVYRGQCSELCGKEHGFMPIVVEVVEQEKYDQWIAEQKKKTAWWLKNVSYHRLDLFSPRSIIDRGTAVLCINLNLRRRL
jgi:cytochrome c oxidase subunit 2